MDIALNITTAPQPIRSKPEKSIEKSKKTLKKKTKLGGKANEFSFNFVTGKQNVKAIVARRRPIKKITSKEAVEKQFSLISKNDQEQYDKPYVKSVVPNKSIALKKKAPTLETLNESKKPSVAVKSNTLTNNTEDSLTLHVVSQPASQNESTSFINTEDSLTLNVFSKPLPKKEQQKRKLNRFERKKLKKEESQRPFSKEELNDALRRFTENPNKRPRVADIFDAEEKRKRKEEQEAKQKPEEAHKNEVETVSENNKHSDEKERMPETEPELEYGAINANARKSNAFRVKRPEEATVKAVDIFRDNPEAREIGQRFVKPIPERIFDGTKVETLPLHPHAIKNLSDLLSISELTTVQRKTIPKALEGKDVLVRAQTGSGKTLAYALPVVEKLQAIRPKITRDDGILAVIIVPTRELVIQTYELFLKLVKPFTWLVPGMLMGGEKRKAEKARLRKGINILIGTPGRLVDHLLHTTSFKLDKSKFLILDEADRLLELGYERDVQQIVEAIGKQHNEADSNSSSTNNIQRMLLSATLTPAVQKLAGLTLHEPVYIDNSEEDSSQALCHTNGYAKETIESLSTDLNDIDAADTGILTIPDNLELNFVSVPPKLRLVTLAGLLRKEFVGKTKFKAIVFMSTMEMVNYHHDLLNEQLTQKILDEDDEEDATNEHIDKDESEPLLKGLRFFKLQGSMTQTERQGVFKSFRECKTGVLLATDVVGRGIDVPEIDLVVQYSPPQFIADFVHRAGRTARAGRKGRAVIFLAPSETQFVRHLEEKRIRLSQVSMEVYLKALKNSDNEARTVQEAASNLQHKFQELIDDDREMHTKACKAFVSWVKFYSTFPRELKPIFNVKKAHMGHFAKSFALKDAPKSFVSKHTAPKPAPPTNRLTYTERDPDTMKAEKRTKHRRFTTKVTNEVRTARKPEGAERTFSTSGPNRLVRMLPNSLALTTSEFDSGLPSMKKKKGST